MGDTTGEIGFAPSSSCKICGREDFIRRAHTARCEGCGVLLFYPYPNPADLERSDSPQDLRAEYLKWSERSAYNSHKNFTDNIAFTIPRTRTSEHLRILDFGGGSGQFALVAKSHLPHAEISIVDVSPYSLLDEWRPLNRQIRFEDFETDETKFDFIFLNDVFEHLPDPKGVLANLRGKLTEDGRLFIDTPRQFWLYPVLDSLPTKSVYDRLLVGTVSRSHLQIWSNRAFERTIHDARFEFEKRMTASALTMDADFYLDQMGIRSGILRMAGRALHGIGRGMLRNKFYCVLKPS